jgi:hypothetical protein
MPYVVTASEYVAIDDVPLATPAWFCDDFTDLLNGAGVRGGDLVVGSRPGQVARRRTLDARQASLSFVIYGDKDPEGNAYSDVRAGLFENIDRFKTLLTPNYGSLAGTRTLTLYGVGSTRVADVHVSPNIELVALGPTAARATVLVTIPAGVFRDPNTETYSYTGGGNKVLEQAGTSVVYDAAIAITGTADSFQIYNNTTAAGIVFGAALTGTITLYCGSYYAERDDLTDLTGYVTTTGSPFWLPIAPGENDIAFLFVNAAGTPSISISTVSAWL